MAKNLYMDGNGRITCADLKCAGMTAHFSGMKRDLYGAPIERVSVDTVREFMALGFGVPKCEGCGSEASLLVTR